MTAPRRQSGTCARDELRRPTLVARRCALYAAASSSASTSAGSASRIRTSQPSPYGILVHRLGRVDDLLVHLEHLARERRDQIGDGLHRLDLAVGAVLRERRADVRRLVVDELAERVLGVPGDAERRLVALDAGPVVLGVVPESSG